MACLKEIMGCAATMSVPCFKEMAAGVDPSVVNALALVGGLVLVRSAICFLGAVFATFLRPGKNLKKYGAWAVVTGATGERACLCTCSLLLETPGALCGDARRGEQQQCVHTAS